MSLINRSYHIILTITIFILGLNVVSNAQCSFDEGPIGQICDKAFFICGNQLDGYVGKLITENSTDTIWEGENSPQNGVCNLGGTFDNTSWFSFVACASTVHIQIDFYSCVHPLGNITNTGIQSGLYTECNKGSSVACDEYFGGTSGTLNLVYNSFIPGDLVYFVLDGYAASVCEFKIKVISGIDTTPVAPPNASSLADGYITGPNVIKCEEKNTTQTFNITPPQCVVANNSACGSANSGTLTSDNVCYVWEVNANSGYYFNNKDSVGTSVDIVFTEPGTYTISVNGYLHPFYGGSCANAACGIVKSWQVVVQSPTNTLNPPIFVCPGDTYDFCGNTISTSQTVTCNSDPCNIVQQPFIFGASEQILHGTQYVCAGSGFEFQGVTYNQAGSYQILDENDCTKLHKFTVTFIDIQIDIQNANLTLDCSISQVTATANVITNAGNLTSSQWKDEFGNVLSVSSNVTLNEIGKYTFEVTYKNGATICTESKTIEVLENRKIPSVSATVPKLRCSFKNDPKPILTLVSNDILKSAQWTTPKGSTFNGMNILADSSNVVLGKPYLFTAIGENGCRLDTSFMVSYNFEKAVVSLTGDDLTCFNPKTTLQLNSNLSLDSMRWARIAPTNSFYGSFQNKLSLEVDQAGTYQARVMTSASRCWSEGLKDIVNRIAYPTVDAGPDQKWHCNSTSIDINPQVSTGSNINYLWATKDGQIKSDVVTSPMTLGGPGTYYLEVSNGTNGCKSRDTILVSQETNMPYEIIADKTDLNCFESNDGAIYLKDINGGFGPYKYFLNGVLLAKNEVQNLKPGEYTLEVRDIYDCQHSISVTIDEPELVTLDLPIDLTVAFNEALDLTFESNYQTNEISEIRWTNSAGDLIGNELELQYSLQYSDVITLEITTINGCVATRTININVDNELKLYFPNVFSPNDDGVNDKFVIFKNKIPANILRLSIYDRYGNKVYYQTNFDIDDHTIGWDGNYNGQKAVPGVYVYVLELEDYLGRLQVIKKDLTLVR